MIYFNTRINKKNIKEFEKTLREKFPYLDINLKLMRIWSDEYILEVKIHIERYNIDLAYGVADNVTYSELINNIKYMCFERISDEIGLGI